MPEMLIRRMEHEFEFCDRIVVPSTLARQSFAEMGYAEKTVVILTGVDAQFFTPRSLPIRPPVFRVCYVGRVELAKGLGYLLQAWRRLALQHAELVLVGDVKPEMSPLLKTYADSTVRLLGILPPQRVAECYRESSVFVFPSVTEGLAQVLLEAMASGLPVVATDKSGAKDCVADGKEGCVVPTRDADAIAEAISWCYHHREESEAMGKAARVRIEDQFTLDHYNQRVIGLYHTLAGARRT